MSNIDVKEIVRLYLVANNYDGLCDEDGCGCHLSDLYPCSGEGMDRCVPGHSKPSDEPGVDHMIFPGRPV